MKKIIICLTFNILFTSLSQVVTAQEYDTQITPIITNQGSNLLTNHLLKDSNGFLWYSVQNGLVRKMGSHHIFYPFNHPLKNDVPFKLNLIETHDGSIIGVTNLGVFFLDSINGILNWVLTPVSPKTKTFINFNSPKEDAKGNIWIGTDTGFVYCYTHDKRLLKYKVIDFPDDIDIGPSIIVMDILDDGSIIIKQKKIGNTIEKQKTRWYRYFNGKTEFIIEMMEKNIENDILQSEISDNGEFFSKNNSGKYWLEEKQYSYSYIPKINRQIFQFPYLKLKKLEPSKIEKENKKPKIAAINKTDLKIFEIDTNNVFYIKNEFHLKNKIRSFIIDSDNSIWANTIDGITSIHPFKKPFTKFSFNEVEENPEKNISCRGITKTLNGNIYIFTYHGWFELKKDENIFQKIEFVHKKTGNPIIDNLYSFYKQNDSVFWAYGYTSNIYKLDPVRKTYTTFTRPHGTRLKFRTTNDIESLDEKTLLLSGGYGLTEFNLITHQFIDVNQLNDTINLKNKNIHDIYFDKLKNELWLGLIENGGLYKKNLTTGIVSHYYKGSKSTPLVDDNVLVISPDGKNDIWIGTEKGLQKINTKTSETTTYTTKNGFKNDIITSIIPDNNYLWIGTYNGLVRLHKKTGLTNVYFKKDGLPNNEFNKKSFLKVNNDSLFFGGISGLVGFNPKGIEYENKKNQLFLAEAAMYNVEQNNNLIQTKNLQTLASFNIPYSNNYLNLKFAINDILYPETHTFKYRIIGLSELWNDMGNYDELQLQGIIPGNYEIQIQGYNSNGKTTNILKYNLNVEQIFYKKTWFISLCLLVVTGLFLGWNLYRRSIIKEQFKLQHKFDILETKALRAQMNPHFIFNALNGIQSVMILKGEQVANKYLVSFSKLLRFTLDMSNSEFISLKDEIKYLNSYLVLESLRLDDNLDYSIDISNNIDLDNTFIPCMLFQPIVENAIIHGLIPKKNNRILKMSIKLENNVIIGKVIDNGIGRKAAQVYKKKNKPSHKSWATHIMNERINISNSLHKEKIAFVITDLQQNGKSTGTEAALYIPLKKKNTPN